MQALFQSSKSNILLPPDLPRCAWNYDSAVGEMAASVSPWQPRADDGEGRTAAASENYYHLKLLSGLAGGGFFLKKRGEELSRANVCVCVMEGCGGWREVGVLVPLKSVTHRAGMVSRSKNQSAFLCLPLTHSLKAVFFSSSFFLHFFHMD